MSCLVVKRLILDSFQVSTEAIVLADVKTWRSSETCYWPARIWSPRTICDGLPVRHLTKFNSLPIFPIKVSTICLSATANSRTWKNSTLNFSRFVSNWINLNRQRLSNGLKWPEFSNKRRKLQVTPKQANYMDPQVRMLLEVSWEAMIDAGTTIQQYRWPKGKVDIHFAIRNRIWEAK